MNIPVKLKLEAAWVPDPFIPATILPGDTTDDKCQIIPEGGLLPLSIVNIFFPDGTPGLGISLLITTTTITNDTFQIVTTNETPEFIHSFRVRAIVNDDASPPQSVQVDVKVSLDVIIIGVNTFAATLAALLPNHNWALDELSGNFIDSGETGGIDLTEAQTNGVWRQAPSPIRGAPREYALWGDQTLGSGLESSSSALAAVGFTTGTMLAVIHIYSLNTETIYPLIQVYNNNVNIFVGLRVNTDGSVEYLCQNSSAFNDGFTAAGAVVEGGTYFVVGVQRADGNGPRVYLNAIDLTDGTGQAGGASIDDWADQIIGAQTATDFNVGGINNITQGGAIIGRPAIFRNEVLTDIEIAALFAAIGGFQQTPTDYFEKVFDLSNGSKLNLFWTGRTGSAGRMTGWVEGAAEAEMLSASGISPPSLINVADSDLVTAYQSFKTHFDPGQLGRHTTSTDVSPIFGASDTIGTVNVIARITSAPVGVQKNMVAIGDFTADRFELSIVGTASGFEFKFRMEINTGDFIQAVGDSLFPTLPQFMMFTVTQTGAAPGYRLYINGAVETFTETGGGGAVVDTSWIAQIVASSGAPDLISLSAVPGSSSIENWEPNDISKVEIYRKAITAAEVAELYDATLGIFAA